MSSDVVWHAAISQEQPFWVSLQPGDAPCQSVRQATKIWRPLSSIKLQILAVSLRKDELEGPETHALVPALCLALMTCYLLPITANQTALTFHMKHFSQNPSWL